MNEADDSFEEVNEEEILESKLKEALKRLMRKDVVARVRGLFNIIDEKAVSIYFPGFGPRKNVLHFIVNVDEKTIFDAAKIAYDIQLELGYEEFNGINIQLKTGYVNSAFGEVFMDPVSFSAENWKNVVSFLKRHYSGYLHDNEKVLTTSQEIQELGIFKSPDVGSPKTAGQDKKHSSSKETSSEDTSPRVDIVEHKEEEGRTTIKFEVTVNGKFTDSELETAVRSLLREGVTVSHKKNETMHRK